MSIRRILVAVLLAIAALTVIWYSVGRRWTERYVESMTGDWVSFQIPANSPTLNAVSVSHEGSAIAICNKGTDRVSDLLVRLNDVYVAKFGALQPHDCKTIPITEFRTFTWKKIPAAAGMQLKKLEVLGTISQRAYLRLDVPPQAGERR